MSLMPFSISPTEIPEVLLITYQRFPDERGYFAELYKSSSLPFLEVRQVNMSFSRKGVVRGLHYQLKPFEQGKLVTVLQGRILDLALDIRLGSPTYGKFVTREITPGLMLWVPPGFAHGFQALEESTVVYFTSKEYSPAHERCVHYLDLGIRWPLDAIVNRKDSSCPPLSQAENNFSYP